MGRINIFLLFLQQTVETMANFRNLLKGGSLGGILTSVVGMVAGKVVADKMQQ